MTAALAFPFRFYRRRAATVDATSEEYAAQRIASVISTKSGELPLLPFFGTDPPEFSEFDAGGLHYTCAAHFPDIEIQQIEEEVAEDGRLIITVEFEQLREDPNNGFPGP